MVTKNQLNILKNIIYINKYGFKLYVRSDLIKEDTLEIKELYVKI